MQPKRIIIITIPLAINILISWTILPFAMNAAVVYSIGDLFEVILWQGIGLVGWPLAIVSGLLSLLISQDISQVGAMVMIMIYPAILALLVRALFVKVVRLWDLAIPHLLIALSFVVIWAMVLNGYDFMLG